MKFLLSFIFVFLSFVLSAQKPGIVFPKNSQVLADTSITLIWDAYPNATQYQLTLASDSLFQNKILNAQSTTDNRQPITLNSNTTYHGFIRYFTPSTSFTSDTFSFTVFSPKDLDSLSLWFDPNYGIIKDSANKVQSWFSQTIDTVEAFQSTYSYRPLFMDSLFLDKPGLLFNGNEYLSGNYMIPIKNYDRTIFLLATSNSNTLSIPFSNFDNGVSSQYVLEFLFNKYSFGMRRGNKSSLTFNYITIPMFSFNLICTKLFISNISCSNQNNNFKTSNFPLTANNIQRFSVSGRTDGISNVAGFRGKIFDIIDINKLLNNSEISLVNTYLLHKYTPPLNIGPNILRRYGFCDTVLRTEKQYESYLWSTGDTTREITVAKEDTGWYWCQVPNLYGQIMRDSVYVYNLLPKQDIQDTTICLGDTITYISSFAQGYQIPPQANYAAGQLPPITPQANYAAGQLPPIPPQANYAAGQLPPPTPYNGYTFLWQDLPSGDTLSQSPSLQLAPSHHRPIALSVFDSLGCFITDTFNIFVDSFPVLASLGPDKSLCTGDKIGLEIGANEADSFLWNTGATDSLLVIQTAGTYSLSTWNTRACNAKDTIQVDIHGITPYVVFSAAPVCFGDSTTFIDSSMSLDQSNLISWSWEYGDGKTFDTLVPSSPRTLYDSAALYTAKLTVSTDSGCTNYAYTQVLVRPLPQPNFMPLTSCQNHDVQLQNLSIHTDSIVTYRWIFNNIDTLFANSPTRQFPIAGIQSIELTPYDIHGCKQSVNKDFEVRPSPVADFKYSTQCRGQEVFFSDYSTTSATNPIQNYLWEFNVGSPLSGTSNLQSPSFKFLGAGLYPVKLQVNSLNGCWDTLSKQIKVHAFPKANFQNDTACQGHEFLFYNNSSVQNDTIKESQWDFGDGNAVLHLPGTPSPTLSYRYEDSLSHQVTLVMVSQAHCTDTLVRFVKAHPNPKPQFSMSRQYGLPPLEVAFTNQSTGIAPLQSLWTFGDGAQSTQYNVVHQYLDSAIFYPQLQITDALGCWDTLSQPLYVIYAAIDVAISEVRMATQNQKMKFSCTLRNQGKQPIHRLLLSASYPGSFALIETWEGTLDPGSSIDYEFKALMALKEGETMPPYYCISAQLPDDAPQADERPENNSLCKDISSSFWVGEPYPNPINDRFNLDLILEYSKDCEIRLLDSQGSQIQTYLLRGVKGLNQWQFILPNLQSGAYYMQINVPEQSPQVRKVVVRKK